MCLAPQASNICMYRYLPICGCCTRRFFNSILDNTPTRLGSLRLLYTQLSLKYT
ncbi:hypothetical protein Plhal304r1_c039g0117111 [Plasmopara halstedii]